MTDEPSRKDKFDQHYRIAEFYTQVRNDRRQYEWRVTLGLWLTLAAGIVAAKDLPKIPMGYVCGLLAAVLICHLGWLLDNFDFRNRDTDRAYKHLIEAEKISGLRLATDPKPIPSTSIWSRIKEQLRWTNIKELDWTRINELKNKVPLWEFLGTLILCATFGTVFWFHLHPVSQPSL